MALATKPTAIRRLKRLPSGQMGISFVDAQTGEEVPQDQLSTYNIVEQAGNEQTLADLGLKVEQPEAPQDQPAPQSNTTAQEVISSGDETLWDAPGKRSVGKQSVNDSVQMSTKGQHGYIDKPGLLNLASQFGPLKTPAKIASTLINANNVRAVGTAREQMGLPDRSLMEKGRSILMGQSPYVTDVKMDGKQYGVGFEALGPAGRTMLTPQEALKRGKLSKSGMTEATKNQAKLAQLDYQAANPTQAKGPINDIRGAIGNFFSNIFSDSSDDTSARKEDQYGFIGANNYPDTPSVSSSQYTEDSVKDQAIASRVSEGFASQPQSTPDSNPNSYGDNNAGGGDYGSYDSENTGLY